MPTARRLLIAGLALLGAGLWCVSSPAQFGAVKPIVAASCYPGGNDSATKALLPFDGPDDSTTITDVSQYHTAWTAIGNTHIDHGQSKFGGASVYLDGTGDYVQATSNAIFTIGTADFTIDFWFRPETVPAGFQLIDFRPAATSGFYPLILRNNTQPFLDYFVNSGTRIAGATTIAINTWYHYALAKSGTATKQFINGTQDGPTFTDSSTYIYSGNRPLIGASGFNTGASIYFRGNIDELRISIGTARWTANFTPPSAAYCPIY